MKKIFQISTIFAMTFVFASTAMAQVNVAAVGVQAEVLPAITATNAGDLNFGQLVQSSSATVDPQGTANSGLLDAPTYGQVDIAGVGTFDIDISLSTSAFNLGDGTNTISFTPLYAGGTVQSSAADLTTDGVNTVSLVAGAYTVWVGGTIADAGTNSGTFTSSAANAGGDISISVVYN